MKSMDTLLKAKITNIANELLKVCENAIEISSLWVYKECDTDPEFAKEAKAVGKLEAELKRIIKKATPILKA